jgi:glycosyltransferase involved in cell wall biosynthesis
MPTVFFAFRDAPDRRAALRTAGALDRYRLFGLDEVEVKGVAVRHNLERGVRRWARVVDAIVNQLLALLGGYGGDFATVLSSLRTANVADVVFATSDTVGLPIVLLKRFGLVKPPVVYAAIGLPERLAQLRGRRMHTLYRKALRGAHTIIAYSVAEARHVQSWVGAGTSVCFVPFGVDTDAFSPDDGQEPSVDVVSVGADPRRDFGLLAEVASRQPQLSFRLVTTPERARGLGALPANVGIETGLPLEAVRDRLAEARVVALPVERNTYSGATTVLLQAMALAKPVVVSRTDAIAEGYGLEDGANCRLVEPGDVESFERALVETVAGAEAGIDLGVRARELVERNFSWERYTSTLSEILFAASGAPAPLRRRP